METFGLSGSQQSIVLGPDGIRQPPSPDQWTFNAIPTVGSPAWEATVTPPPDMAGGYWQARVHTVDDPVGVMNPGDVFLLDGNAQPASGPSDVIEIQVRWGKTSSPDATWSDWSLLKHN